ncbi:ATP-binding cassette domain-containing protein [Alisedimentitalea sp. MJ-SS2]|uniref:ATP-binding cassette domain-containing protein n=1 Tax=Aliisedimentitalea sp. MJ-SS2 TaxID=3049795 RepID=UPI0029129A55|nr:ATP-binding cassette domain-containing protein [Alisedimentitalea sp. MJ-SS2]MDU8929925.1 ATP-binding cassette domain-containing protein [Alisedimentitalea sp. MJ-SS2]
MVFGTGSLAFAELDDVSFMIAENVCFTLRGPSACGKTPLLRTIAEFITPTTGAVQRDEQNIVPLPPQIRPKSEIAATVEEMLEPVQMTAIADRRASEISGG